MKMLVISLAGIGDTLIATPLIHELRANFPDAIIDALVLWPGSRDLLAGNPWLNRIHQQDFFQIGRRATLKYLLGLRRERYDVSLNTHPQSKVHYRLAAWLVGAPRRLSHRYDNWTPLDRLLVNRTVPQDYSVHSLENNLRLLHLLDKQPALKEHEFELFLAPEEVEAAAALAKEHRLADARVLGVHVGSGRTKNLELKRWPLPNWLALVRRLTQEQPTLKVLLFGGPEEKEENETILREVSPPNVLAPRTRSVREAIALLRHCEGFVSVDNALMHFAAAMKVPRQVLIESPTFGPTLEPYRRPYVLVPNPAVHGRNLEFYRYDGRGIRGSRRRLLECMKAVTVDAVYRAVTQAMGLRPAGV
jgi:heptosyltransferase-2